MKIKYGRKSKGHTFRNVLITILSVVVIVPVVTVAGYVGYVMGTYYRIGDVPLEVTKKSLLTKVESNKELTISTYNIGFGAYSDDYTFFMDSGYDENGNPTSGEHGKARSKDEVIKNTNGAIEVIQNLDSDFYLIQEVDSKSHRAHFVNQREIIETNLPNYDSTYAINYDSAYLFYPFHDPHGKTLAGVSTFSKYSIKDAERKEYVITDGFSKYTDLDRCFSSQKFEVNNGKELIVINSHMSAYDEGGIIRNAQLKQLNEFMTKEFDKGNYVICGGDFNHDLLTNNPATNYTTENFAFKDQIKQLKPDWLSMMFNENKETSFDEDFKVYASDNEPTCRDADVTYQKGYTYVSTIDGFVCSSNVEVKSILTTKTGENGFEYSDHQPATLTFKLI